VRNNEGRAAAPAAAMLDFMILQLIGLAIAFLPRKPPSDSPTLHSGG
jgi:hypothetical protein